jgi:hypothetical protein
VTGFVHRENTVQAFFILSQWSYSMSSPAKPWGHLPRRAQPLLYSLLMSMFMACAMSCVLTAVNTGIDGNFLQRWLRAFIVAWPFAFMFVQIFVPLTRRILSRIEFYP